MEPIIPIEVLAIFGVFFCIVSVLVFIFPHSLLEALQGFTINTALRLFASLVRIGLGTMVLSIAEWTQFALTLKVIGVLLIVSGVVILLMSSARLQSIVDWFVNSNEIYIRLGGVGGFLFGCFLVYAVI